LNTNHVCFFLHQLIYLIIICIKKPRHSCQKMNEFTRYYILCQNHNKVWNILWTIDLSTTTLILSCAESRLFLAFLSMILSYEIFNIAHTKTLQRFLTNCWHRQKLIYRKFMGEVHTWYIKNSVKGIKGIFFHSNPW